MKILVTGGAGFIGSHLCARLREFKHSVTVQDDLSTGKWTNLPRGTYFEKKDICEGIVEDKFDWIFNLACPASPIQYQKNKLKTAMTNAIGAVKVMDLAMRTGARVFQASTSEVYGDPLVSPQREDYWGNVNPIGPRACYDEGKRFAETIIYDYHRDFNVDVRVGRIFNTYGPRMAIDDGRVVSNFIVQALKNRAITIYGKGKQTRSFCFVDDMVDAILTLMMSDETRPTNLGTTHEMTMIELAETIIDLTNSRSKIVFRPLPEDDPKQRRPNLKRIKNLGWKPTVKLEQGLMETIEYFRGIV